MVVRKVVIENLHFPVDVYNYDVKLLTSIDDGETYWYAGFGKFAKTLEEANTIKIDLEKKNNII